MAGVETAVWRLPGTYRRVRRVSGRRGVIQLATTRACAAVVVVSTFTAMRDVGGPPLRRRPADRRQPLRLDQLHPGRSCAAPRCAWRRGDEVAPYAFVRPSCRRERAQTVHSTPGRPITTTYSQAALFDAVADFAEPAGRNGDGGDPVHGDQRRGSVGPSARAVTPTLPDPRPLTTLIGSVFVSVTALPSLNVNVTQIATDVNPA